MNLSTTHEYAAMTREPTRFPRMGMMQALALVFFGLVVWLVIFTLLRLQPATSLGQARGVYEQEGVGQTYRWTGSRMQAPIYGHSGPTDVRFALRGGWPGRTPPVVTIGTGAKSLVQFSATDEVRVFHVLLTPGSGRVELRTQAELPAEDTRWLGVQLFGFTAQPYGLPVRAAADAVVGAGGSILLALLVWWSSRRGWGALVVVTLLGLFARILRIHDAPGGFFWDETISLVDAWHLLHTGRDHLGNFLPLGAQEAFGDWISPLLTYLELPVVAVLGPTPLAGRLVTVATGTLVVPAMYGLARALRLPTAAALGAALVCALSPWQIFLSRLATPPALVPLAWTLCLWMAVRVVRSGTRRDALLLALAAGFAPYAYPTMKMLVPLFVGLTLLLALAHHGWRAAWPWLAGAVLLGVLWLPFAMTTLFNQASSMRFSRKALRADTTSAWITQWAVGYGSYFGPSLYYRTGDPFRGIPEGTELLVEAPLLVLGVITCAWYCLKRPQSDGSGLVASRSFAWWLIAGAIILAPLPASLTGSNPHLSRAGSVPPLYALLVGIGLAGLWHLTQQIGILRQRRIVAAVGLTLLGGVMLWQSAGWFRRYVNEQQITIARSYQEGLLEAVQWTITEATDGTEVWIDGDINTPYIYLLAADPRPPAELQRQLVVRRALMRFNVVSFIDRYRFVNLQLKNIPPLPAEEVFLDRFGRSGFVTQRWQQDGKPVLIVRRVG